MPKYVVCPECDGEGKKGPGFVWTESDMAQEDPEEFAQMQRDLRVGRYDVPCWFCEGQRVVTNERRTEYREELEYRAEVEAERRMGA